MGHIGRNCPQNSSGGASEGPPKAFFSQSSLPVMQSQKLHTSAGLACFPKSLTSHLYDQAQDAVDTLNVSSAEKEAHIMDSVHKTQI
eukprot:3317052-Karenia_brevis.AAC.1